MAIKSKNKDTFAQDMNQQEREVYESFRSMLDALCEGDTSRLSGIISDEARFADMKGRLVSKAEYLEDVADGSISYTKVQLKDVRIMIADGDSEKTSDNAETDTVENEGLDVIDLDADDEIEGNAAQDSKTIASQDAHEAVQDSHGKLVEAETLNDAADSSSDEAADITCDGATATLTCTAHMKARLSGMSGSFKRHLIAFFRKEDGIWRYTGG